MSKKGQAAQLQQEANNDEEWEKLLQAKCLIVADIYCEWAGPCSSMLPTLKKIKMDFAGDNLQLIVAKADGITVLERFRGSSEPTWMFIADGKMVNLMFGADGPKLSRLMLDELKKDSAARDKVAIEITQLSEEERKRYEVVKKIEDEKIRMETERKAQVLKDRRLAVANVVLANIINCGVILVFPQAMQKVAEVLAELWEPAGLLLASQVRVHITQEMLEELLYFTNIGEVTEKDQESLLTEISVAYLVKPAEPETFTEDIDSAILTFVYGEKNCSPGSEGSPAQLLMGHIPVVVEDTFPSLPQSVVLLPSASVPSSSAIREPASVQPSREAMAMASAAELKSKTEMSRKSLAQSKIDMKSQASIRQSKVRILSSTSVKEEIQEKVAEKQRETIEVTGLWAPPNALVKATAIKVLFPKLYDPIALPEPMAIPPHIAIAFDVIKKREILHAMEDYPGEIIRYGFFTDDNPETAKIIGKSVAQYNKFILSRAPRYPIERLVIQLAKKRSEPWCVFSQLGPTFMSHTVEDGERHCKLFFKDNYDDDTAEEEVEIEARKAPTKKQEQVAQVVVEPTAVEEENAVQAEEEQANAED